MAGVSSGEDRSSTAQAIAQATLVGGLVRTWGLDRGRVVLGSGIKAAAAAKGHGPLGGSARFAREFVRPATVFDYLRGPTTNTVDVTHGLWRTAHRASTVLGLGLTGAIAVSAVTNSGDGIADGGIDGLLTTQSGRSGALFGAEMIGGFGFPIAAGLMAREPGQGFLAAATGSEWLAKPGVRTARWGVGLVAGLGLLANELPDGGMFRFLDEG